MSYQVKTEKWIARPAADVFKALEQGRLFLNCSADSGSMKIDFRVGGKYHIEFKNHKVSNFGEFVEIIRNKKLVFTWCQTFGEEQKPDTQVTIELAEEAGKTKLMLVHTGFNNKATCDDHEMGWTGGLNDMTAEMEKGRLRMVRRYNTSVEKLYEACKNPESFFAYMGDLSRGSVDFKVGGHYQVPTQKGEIKGEFVEIVPNKKITLTWLAGCGGPFKDSRVALMFNARDNGGSALELIHDGLISEDAQTAHRQGWEAVTEKLSSALGYPEAGPTR